MAYATPSFHLRAKLDVQVRSNGTQPSNPLKGSQPWGSPDRDTADLTKLGLGNYTEKQDALCTLVEMDDWRSVVHSKYVQAHFLNLYRT